MYVALPSSAWPAKQHRVVLFCPAKLSRYAPSSFAGAPDPTHEAGFVEPRVIAGLTRNLNNAPPVIVSRRKAARQS
jgi:hypothetical protein